MGAIGAGTMLAGSAMNVYGQNQGLNAMRKTWGDARERQSGYDQKLNDRQQQMMAQINPQAISGVDAAARVGGKMDASVRTATKAAQKQAGRKRGNAEGKAVARQAQGGQLAQLLRSGQLAAMIQGLQSGGQNVDMIGRQAALDSNIIRNDARTAAGLVPMYENAAQMRGAGWRQGGQMLSGLGQAAMMYGMSKPAGGSPSNGPTSPGLGADAPLTGGLYSPGEASAMAGQRATYLTNADLPGWK